MKKFTLVIINLFLMILFNTAMAVKDDGYLNPVDLDLRYYFEQLDRFPDRLGVVCWASYELHKEGRHSDAENLLNKCADRGLVTSMLLLANIYELGVNNNTQQAEVSTLWLRRAALTNDSRGQLYYGLALLKGKGVKSNPRIAQQWLQLAANQGDSDAQNILSTFK